MKSHRPLRAALIAAALATAALAATAAAPDIPNTRLQPLSEDEMASVYGRGLSAPTLQALAGLSLQDQGAAFATAVDVAPMLGALSVDGAQSLDRQLAQQRVESATTGLQATLKLAQTMASVARLLGPVSLLSGFGLLGGLGGLGSLTTGDGHKH